MYLNEVGIQPSQQHSFKQLILVAVLIVERGVTLAVTGMRNKPGVMQIITELRYKTCNRIRWQKYLNLAKNKRAGIFNFQKWTETGCKRLTVYKTKAGLGQGVSLQKVIPVLSVAVVLNFPPAQNSSTDHQIVTVAWATQSLFGLNKQSRRLSNSLANKNMAKFIMVKTSHLVD